MSQLFDIQKVTVGPRALDANVRIAPEAPFYTSDDAEGTERVLGLMPELSSHLCLGDADGSFGNVVRDTEVAHLLEHVTVELVARTGLAGRVSSGQTTQLDASTFRIRLDCPDDVLVTGALSSAEWILEWAYSGGGEPTPNVEAIVEGLRNLVGSVSSSAEELVPTENDSDATEDGQASDGEAYSSDDDDWFYEGAATPRPNR